MPELQHWDSVCVIVGSAAGTLIGLQFVVMTLIAERPPLQAAETAAAYSTPTIVHFGAALLLCAVLRAPWESVSAVATLWGLIGLLGTGYSIVVMRRMRRQIEYQAQLEDWVFHAAAPLVAYALLLLSAFGANPWPRQAVFCVFASVLALLFIGIHNAWDSVAYLVDKRSRSEVPPRK